MENVDEKAKVYIDYCKLLEDLDVDVVLIVMFLFMYYEMVVVVVQVGKYVYCEKMMIY